MTAMRRHPRGFSLIEVLMAVFILGIGAISIAALFPAGIVQQRQANDDVMGPIVAANAIEVLRTRLQPRYFGTYEDFTPFDSSDPLLPPRWTNVVGDWSWHRPGFILSGNDRGALDIFSHDRVYDDTSGAWEHWSHGNSGYNDGTTSSDPPLFGIPFAGDWQQDDGRQPPRIIISQSERYYPQAVYGDRQARPQYVWDCMFRRHYGRILVAIFVYRVSSPGGEQSRGYTVVPEVDNRNMPPIPVLPPPRGTPQSPEGAWDAWGVDQIRGTADDLIVPTEINGCGDFDPQNRSLAWHQSGQWLLDQNNNVHRVLGAFCDDDNTPVVELARPIPWSADLAGDYILDSSNGVRGIANVVTDIWYVPLTDADGNTLTPVYVTVKEL